MHLPCPLNLHSHLSGVIPLTFVASEPQFKANAQTGVFWVLTPLKAWVPPAELVVGPPWYYVKVPMEASVVGYLDLRVVLIELVILVGLIVAVPLVAAKKNPDVRLAACA